MRVTIDDDSILPVQAFFNAVSDWSFVLVMDALTNGVGWLFAGLTRRVLAYWNRSWASEISWKKVPE